MPGDWLHLVLFSAGIAVLSTLAIAPLAIFSAWALARSRWPGKTLVETLLMLPLFLPPVATGLVLLLLFGRHGPLGSILERWFSIQIVFTWRAVLIACGTMAFPMLWRAAQASFEAVDPRLEQIARTLGASERRVFFTITLPLASRGIAAGMVLAFARALGEFGATAVVAGMIPGRTMTLSLSIYQMIQLGHDHTALALLAVSVCIAFGAVWCGQLLQPRSMR